MNDTSNKLLLRLGHVCVGRESFSVSSDDNVVLDCKNDANSTNQIERYYSKINKLLSYAFLRRCRNGLVVMTTASHAVGPEFNSRFLYFYLFFNDVFLGFCFVFSLPFSFFVFFVPTSIESNHHVPL